MSTPEERTPDHAARSRRWTFRSLELERIAAFLDSARLRVASEAIRSRSIERGLRIAGPDRIPPDPAVAAEPEPPGSPVDPESLIAAGLAALSATRPDRAEPEPPGVFDPCREAPWWRLEDRSGL